ncbi:MAG: NAD(P)H-binding protein [Solirubrobacterales bacterium]|nr:NAD(P)H-binding protein [Solirubrobacterales bacterium]
MAGRIVVFGATGYTGRLTVEALIERGERPVLAGRDAARLRGLASELGSELETAVADVARPASIAELVGPADVLVATVGPFARFGDAAAEAAIAAGAHYLDSTGEPAFIRRVFERFGSRAAEARIAMVTAFGYDWVPGNLAGALALREARGAATRVDLGYFTTGGGLGGMSGGTRASLAGALLEPSFVWRDGIRTERAAVRVRSFAAAGRRREAISVGSSEHFTLPRLESGLREVNAYLGWFGGASRGMQVFSAANAAVMQVPGVRAGAEALIGRLVRGSTGGPDAAAREGTGSAVVAVAYADGAELASVEVRGVNGYEFTGRILAWGATAAAGGGLRGSGALGPAEAFGLDALEAGCREAGIERV